ncbi:DNA-binding MarR family transcriptional regulator [Sphingobium sp. B1D7B]|uniref:MarR family winged helix-turn-helix transcriptional regulator n=1 Tax=Sphingobium TaxID=165695 RepID=UPI0015EC2DE7|nr:MULTISPECIES: MarR family transcriptional regulator [Sphingobium]MCW2361530.1 DNA-binding MarR family transcriptional regulator [Sphingobium sp. B10D3B]MCW2391053.1 DNA-binding MarR family transcriptional regulator [Sphingobium sp. B11D3A]MCW2401791.1 DNA-binding MarR family transcriptional regulator [Sphingobium sp. B10D7B]MCW2406262.1 DNA-binding MarR family transcriptional regulator [Sphingobium sp. B1D7B]MCW2408770.1 DNA-binding MarR family transcriptional regulator [Sphingobium xanthum
MAEPFRFSGVKILEARARQRPLVAAKGGGSATPSPAPAQIDDDIGAIDDIIGFHIRLAHGAAYRHFTETFSELGLTQKMVSVLWLISDHPHIAQADIGRRLQMDRATTMAIINRLEARGLLVRGASTLDRRRQTLTLTADGQAALSEARRCIDEHEQWLKSRFTKKEATLLIELLRRIHE